MIHVTRRSLIFGALVVGTAAAAPTAIAITWPEATLARFLRENVPEVNLSSTEMTTFIKEFQLRWKLSASRQRIVLFLMRNPSLKSIVPRSVRGAQDRQERWIMSSYLFASDFFDNERTAAAAYVDFPDPYESSCVNPLAVLGQLPSTNTG